MGSPLRGKHAAERGSDVARGFQLTASLLRSCVGLGVLAAGIVVPAAAFAAEPPPMRTAGANALDESASGDARKIVTWVIEHGDNESMPFVIVDKNAARAFAFDRHGVLAGAAPVLLGMGTGDRSPDGIGTRRLSSISPAERITPAGRFVAALGENLSGKDILWVDYDAAISLHRVDTAKPSERRLQRLASATVSDNRISYGCINVPVQFFESIVRPLFRATAGIVYILPETGPIEYASFSKRQD